MCFISQIACKENFEIVKNSKKTLCINCLKAKGHQAKDCTSGSCRKYGKAYNMLLHFDSNKISTSNIENQSSILPKLL